MDDGYHIITDPVCNVDCGTSIGGKLTTTAVDSITVIQVCKKLQRISKRD